MNPTSNAAGPARTSSLFRHFQALILLHCLKGKDTAGINGDKLWRCLCNALMWATDGVITGNFLFDINPKKAFSAVIAKKEPYELRSVWIAELEDIIAKTRALYEQKEETCSKELICIMLIEQLVGEFKKDTFAKRASILFQTVNTHANNLPFPKTANLPAIEKVTLGAVLGN